MKGQRNGGIGMAIFATGLSVIIALAEAYRRYFRHDPAGSAAVFGAFVIFFGALGLCASKPVHLLRFLPQAWGRILFGVVAAFAFSLAWSKEGWEADVLIVAAIMSAVVAIIYPVFTIFDPDPQIKKKKPSPAATHEKGAQKTTVPDSPYPRRKARRHGTRKRR